jgi:hypothetical protein
LAVLAGLEFYGVILVVDERRYADDHHWRWTAEAAQVA